MHGHALLFIVVFAVFFVFFCTQMLKHSGEWTRSVYRMYPHKTAILTKMLQYCQCIDSTHSGVASICCEEGQSWKLCHGALMVDFRARCSSCPMTNSFVTNAVLIKRATSCWHLHQLISQTTQYLNSWLSDLLQS